MASAQSWPFLFMPRTCLFSKSSLARLQEFRNSSVCLYEIKRKNLFKSTCPTGSFTCPGLSGSGKRQALMPQCDSPSSVRPVYQQDPNLLITVSADALAHKGARPSADTVPITKSHMFTVKFPWSSMIPNLVF